MVNQVPSPDPLYWATNNYIISGTEEDGAPSLQLLSVGDSLGAAPSFIGIKLLTGGKRPYKAAVRVHSSVFKADDDWYCFIHVNDFKGCM